MAEKRSLWRNIVVGVLFSTLLCSGVAEPFFKKIARRISKSVAAKKKKDDENKKRALAAFKAKAFSPFKHIQKSIRKAVQAAQAAAKDVAASLNVLRSGAVVVIRSHKNGRLLQVHGKHLKATGTDKNDKRCQFTVDRQGNWVGFKHGGKYLQSASVWQNYRHTVRFENANFKHPNHTWEHWRFKGNLNSCFLQNQANGGHISVRNGDVVATHDHRWHNQVVGHRRVKKRFWFFSKWVSVPIVKRFRHPAGTGGWERLRIEVIKTWQQHEIDRANKKRAVEMRAGVAGLEQLEAVYKAKQDQIKAVEKAKLEAKIKQAKAEKAQLEKEKKGSKPEPKKTAALEKLKQGTLVAIKAIGAHDTGKYLEAQAGRYLASTAANEDDPDAQFVVMRYKDWITFKSYKAGGNNLQAVPKKHSHEVRFQNKNFAKDEHSWEHWALIPEKEDSLEAVRLHNQGTGGFLCIPDKSWDGERLWTCKDSQKRAATAKDEGTKFAIDVLQEVDDTFKAGKKVFTYAPEVAKERVLFNSAWKFAQKGKGWVRFRVKALEGVSVVLGTEAKFDKGNHLAIVIGHAGNTGTVIVKNDKPQVTLNNAKLKNGLPGNAAEYEDIWVAWSGKGIISAGFGDKVGEGAIASWRDPEPIKDLQYIGLGNSSVRAEFANIKFSPPPPPVPDVLAPKGFSQIDGKMDRVAIGVNQKGMTVWAVDDDGGLHQWQDDAWQEHVAKGQDDKPLAKAEHVAVGADGTVYMTTVHGDVYQYVKPGMDQALLPLPGFGAKAPEKPVSIESDQKVADVKIAAEQQKRFKRRKRKLKRRVKRIRKKIKKTKKRLKKAKGKRKKQLKRRLKRLKRRLKRNQKRLKKLQERKKRLRT